MQNNYPKKKDKESNNKGGRTQPRGGKAASDRGTD